MGPLVQARKVGLPNLMVFAQEPGDDPIVGFLPGISRTHPSSPCPCIPRRPMVIDSVLLRKRTIRDVAAFIRVHCVNTFPPFLARTPTSGTRQLVLWSAEGISRGRRRLFLPDQLAQTATIGRMVKGLGVPININVRAGLPGVAALEALGVAREHRQRDVADGDVGDPTGCRGLAQTVQTRCTSPSDRTGRRATAVHGHRMRPIRRRYTIVRDGSALEFQYALRPLGCRLYSPLTISSGATLANRLAERGRA